jgi:hypothetical protein
MKLLIALFFSLAYSLTFAAPQLETIQLNHRLASEVLPEIKAFLPKGATARAYNELIIIQAEPSVIRNTKKLINTLDTPPQRIRVSVLKTDEVLARHQQDQVTGGVVISDDNASGNLSIKRWSTNKSQNKERNYQAQGIAGKPILINMGQDIPQHDQYLYFNQLGGIGSQTTTRYISLENGFKAVARILPNNQVIIDIHPSFASLSQRNGIINTGEIISTITGAAGTWLELGQVDNEKNLEKQGSSSYHTHRQQQQTIYIKVDQI